MADDNKTEDDISAWEAMLNQENQAPASAGESDAPSATKKALNQDEIDRLLGINSGSKEEDKNKGIKALIDRAMKSYQKLPMLEIVCDRYARIVSTNLRSLTSENVDVDIAPLKFLRFSDYINSVPIPALLTIFKVVEWDNFGIVNMDGEFIYSMVDLLFGGRKVSRPVRFDGKPFTNIEQTIAKQTCDILMNDLSNAFEPISPATFLFERTETNPRFANIARPGDAAILIEMVVRMEERGGKVQILIPYATLEPVKDLLTQVFLGEKFGKDTAWEMHLSNELQNLDIVLEAILDEKTTNFEDIIKLDIGHTILLDLLPGDNVTIRCEGSDMFSGKMGTYNDKIAVSVEKAIHKKLVEMGS